MKRKGALEDVAPIMLHYFGSRVAGRFAAYYAGKPDREVVESCGRMLGELLGPEKAWLIIALIYEKYGLKRG